MYGKLIAGLLVGGLFLVFSVGAVQAEHCTGLEGEELQRCENPSHPIGGANDLNVPHPGATDTVRNNIINTIFFIAGILAVIFIIVGGLKYVLSAGNPESTQKAKNTILYAVIGLVVTVFAFTILNFVISNI